MTRRVGSTGQDTKDAGRSRETPGRPRLGVRNIYGTLAWSLTSLWYTFPALSSVVVNADLMFPCLGENASHVTFDFHEIILKATGYDYPHSEECLQAVRRGRRHATLLTEEDKPGWSPQPSATEAPRLRRPTPAWAPSACWLGRPRPCCWWSRGEAACWWSCGGRGWRTAPRCWLARWRTRRRSRRGAAPWRGRACPSCGCGADCACSCGAPRKPLGRKLVRTPKSCHWNIILHGCPLT